MGRLNRQRRRAAYLIRILLQLHGQCDLTSLYDVLVSTAPTPFPRRGVLLHVPVRFTAPAVTLAPGHVGRPLLAPSDAIFDRCGKSGQPLSDCSTLSWGIVEYHDFAANPTLVQG